MEYVLAAGVVIIALALGGWAWRTARYGGDGAPSGARSIDERAYRARSHHEGGPGGLYGGGG